MEERTHRTSYRPEDEIQAGIGFGVSRDLPDGWGPSRGGGGPLPRTLFRSFLATVSDPNFGRGVGVRAGSPCAGWFHCWAERR